MLKISIRDTETRRLLLLEGKLVAPWTDELRSICNYFGSGPDRLELVIDVRGVTDVSTEGEEALMCLMVQGAQFRGAGVFMKQVLKQLARRVRQNDKT